MLLLILILVSGTSTNNANAGHRSSPDGVRGLTTELMEVTEFSPYGERQPARDTLRMSLKQAKEMALESNPTYRMSVLSHRQSKLSLVRNLGSNMLNPNATATYSEIDYSGAGYGMFQPMKGYSFNLSLDQPVFDPIQATGLLQSKIAANTTKSLRKESENWLYYEIENYYLSVLKTQQLVELQVQATRRAEENLRLALKRVELGEVSKLDLLNAEVHLNRAKLNHSASQKNYELAKRVLLSGLGIDEEYELVLEEVDDFVEIPLLPLDSLVRISLGKRPCVRAAREELKSSRIGFWGSFFSFLPQVSFKWLWMHDTEDFPKTASEVKDGAIKSSGWSGSAGISLFTYPFDVWQSKTSVNKSKLGLLSKRLLVLKEAKEAWLEWQRVSENLNLANSMSLAAEEAERLARTQYELGLISSIDLFRASNDRLDAEIAYTAAVYDCKLVGSKLQYVAGGQEVLK